MVSIGSTSSTQLNPGLYMRYPSQSYTGLYGGDAASTQVQQAATLSADSLLSSSLSGAPSLYRDSALGLLSSYLQAGKASTIQVTPLQNIPAGSAAQDTLEQSIANTLPSSAVESGVYTAKGVVQSLPSDVSGSWGSLLASQPNLASTASWDALNQQLVGGLSVYA